ncbi:hypothetical protein K445DRAFT_251554 [Daldinia sp. EC12]|nr:hypothetical protein K445DRAFT_251554 [Daldinia sp. EC12]
MRTEIFISIIHSFVCLMLLYLTLYCMYYRLSKLPRFGKADPPPDLMYKKCPSRISRSPYRLPQFFPYSDCLNVKWLTDWKIMQKKRVRDVGILPISLGHIILPKK